MKQSILAIVALGLCASGTALAADHADAPAVASEPSTDIGDLFAWMSADGKVNLILTVFPGASDTSEFSTAAQYVFHVASTDAYGNAAASSVDIICQFDASQQIACWLGDMDYVTGDASAPAGLSSVNGMMTVHAGLHDDPFFFNSADFSATVDAVLAAAGGLTFDAANCPAVDSGTSSTLVSLLTGATDGAEDAFAPLNVLAIVIQVDATPLTMGGDIVSVWGATRQQP